MLRFRRERYVRRFLNPLNNFQEEDQEIEVRFDPLLSHTAVFNPVLEDKVRLFFGQHDWTLVERVAEATKEQCFMCPPKVREITPRYPDELIPGGRLVRGKSTLFPNLFPIALRHAVIAVGEAHFRRLKDFPPGLVAEGLGLGVDFLKILASQDQEALHGVVCANYLPPAGASLVHPHFQVVATGEPFPQARRFLEASLCFYLDHGRGYWDILAQEEEKGERFIARLGRVVFFTSFAPLGTNEVIGVVEGVHSLKALTEEDVNSLAQGISAVLAGYEDLGYGSFNFTLYLPPLKEETPWFNPFIRLITRQNFYENYRTDDYFLQRQLASELILTPPEKLAEHLKAFFTEATK